MPKDKNANFIEASGQVDAKLYPLACTSASFGTCLEEECARDNKLLLDSWSIAIHKEDYVDAFLGGIPLRLEYKNYKITNDESAKGCLVVTFTTNGKSFEAVDDSVYLNKEF